MFLPKKRCSKSCLAKNGANKTALVPIPFKIANCGNSACLPKIGLLSFVLGLMPASCKTTL